MPIRSVILKDFVCFKVFFRQKPSSGAGFRPLPWCFPLDTVPFHISSIVAVGTRGPAWATGFVAEDASTLEIIIWAPWRFVTARIRVIFILYNAQVSPFFNFLQLIY